MSCHTYSAGDMLGLRRQRAHEGSHEALHKKLYARVNKEQDLGDILRLKPSPLIREASKQTRPSRPRVSVEVNEAAQSTAGQLDGTEADWTYRGRTGSEHAESQPIPAPPGMDKQHKEGFKRFYKAVVSPTHVRVTAGGRIVPNTRGPGSPLRQIGDRHISDTAFTGRSAHSVEAPPPYGFPMPAAGFGPMPGMYPPWLPPMMPGLSQVPGPYHLMPWQMFPPSYAVPPMAGQHSGPHTAASEPPENAPSSKRSESGSAKAASVQGPAPDRSQYRRFPLPSPGWMMPPGQPYGTLPPAGYHLGAMPGSFFPGNRRDHYPVAPKSSTGSETQSTTDAPRVAQTPHISSIRPSEITKKQIDVLCQNLKYQEDQLLYNKHQIDEKAMEQRIEMVKEQIRHFEKNLGTQLKFESNYYPKNDATRNQPNRSELSRDASMSKASVVSKDSCESGPHKLKNGSSNSLSRSAMNRVNKEEKTTFNSGINSTKSVSGFAPLKHPFKDMSQEETVRSPRGLTAAAALAPPFEPHTSLDVPKSESRATSIRAEVPRDGGFHNSTAKSDLRTKAAGDHSSANLGFNRPYLIGFLPQEMNPAHALDTDYAYPRPLTQDELRARHMYWGKTPHHLQKGLPKFDGKDFYPPSPTKESSVTRDTSSSRSVRRVPVGSSSMDYGWSNESDEAELFRSLRHTAVKPARGPFGAVTQSETLMKSEEGTDEISLGVVSDKYGDPFGSPINDENTDPINLDKSKDGCSSDDGEDDKKLLFKGRNPSRQNLTRAQHDMWRTMLKKGKSSGNAIPGSVSSTTVQGILPQYAGHATASLTPTIVNSPTPIRTLHTKPVDVADASLNVAISERKRENLPPMAASD